MPNRSPPALAASTTVRRRPARSRSSSSPPSPSSSSTPSGDADTSAAVPLRGWRRVLYWAWKAIQTALCIVSFFACGGFFCGGCCVPCGRTQTKRANGVVHRRRRRRSVHQQPTTEPHQGAEDTKVNGAGYQSWNSDEDDDYEYEPLDTGDRQLSSGFCKLLFLLIGLLFGYALLFVRVVPTTTARGGDLEVEFGFNNYIPSIGVPIPEQLHSSLHALMGDASRPGLVARAEGLRAHFPVVFVPGIVSTGLEVWEGEKCAKAHFRQRMWGSTLMLRSILLDSRCWLRHLSLDGWTGLDPPGIKLRAANGLEASDYLVGGYWVWAKIIENLGDIGYDSGSLFAAPYDWRLGFKQLQKRDFYFSRLKATIELAKLSNYDRKVVLMAHSMGGNVVLYFFRWVESPAGGNGGPNWVSDHIESFASIGAPFLGTPKVYSALFSGEMRDTAELAPFIDYWRQRVVFSQSDVLNIMRTFRSLSSMYPKGGDVVWGDSQSAPDDSVAGEDEKPQPNPTKDYPGGQDTRFVTSQATAELKDRDKYEDTERLRKVVTEPPRYGGQFLSFTAAIPWPFPNITDLVDQARRNQSAMRATGQSMEDWTQKLRESIAIDPEKADPKATKTELSVEESLELLRMIAWPDIAFNDELYSQGFGAVDKFALAKANETEPAPAADTTSSSESSPLPMLNLDPKSDLHVLDDQRYWLNPLEMPLPFAPHLKIFCQYGVGLDSERGYVYTKASAVPTLPRMSDLLTSATERVEQMQGTEPNQQRNGDDSTSETPPEQPPRNTPDESSDPSAGANVDTPDPPIHYGPRAPTIPLFALNTSYHDLEARTRSGVKLSDGDGTVPLVSMGYMCIDGWKQSRWNPAGMSVITREYRDLNASLPLLRSSSSVDHVDIMGNSELIDSLLHIVAVRMPKSKRNDLSDEAEGVKQPESEALSSSTEREVTDPPTPILTWPEVSERVYSRIRPISQRVHDRWEKRTGHQLHEADKPPPLNPGQGYAKEQADSTTDDSSSARKPLNFDWADTDEEALQRLIEKKRRRDMLKRDPAEQALERAAEARASRRAATEARD